MRAGGFPGNPGGLVVSILKTAGARAPAHQARGRGRRTWRPTERTAGARMVPPGEGNEARGDGRRGVGVSHSTAEAGELSPRDPVEGRGHRQVAPLEGKTANTPRLGPVSTSRQRIAELARQALGMAVAIAWLPGPAGTRRRVAKLSVEEPDAAEPARPDLWEARVSNDPGLPDRAAAATTMGVGAGLHGFGLSEDADPLASSTAAGAQFPREFEGAPEVQDEISRRKLARVRTSPRGARRRDTLALRRRDGRVETCAVWSAGRAEEILGPRDRDRIDAPARLPVALAPDRGLLAVGPGLDAPRPRSARSHHALAAESAPRSRSRSHSGPGASSSHRRQHGPVDRRRGRMGRGETRGTRQARLEEAPSRCRPIRRDRCPSADRTDGR